MSVYTPTSAVLVRSKSSGAIKRVVPMHILVLDSLRKLTVRASPKSANRTLRPLSSRMFSGLRSLWIMGGSQACRYASQRANCIAMFSLSGKRSLLS